MNESNDESAEPLYLDQSFTELARNNLAGLRKLLARQRHKQT